MELKLALLANIFIKDFIVIFHFHKYWVNTVSTTYALRSIFSLFWRTYTYSGVFVWICWPYCWTIAAFLRKPDRCSGEIGIDWAIIALVLR